MTMSMHLGLSASILAVSTRSLAAADEGVVRPPPSVVVDVAGPFPMSEIPLPEEMRTDGREVIVIPSRSARLVWLVDLASASRRAVHIAQPEGIDELRIASVDRVGPNRLVASARWSDGGEARNGLVVFDEQGRVGTVIPHDFEIRSIVVGPTKEWIVGSILEPKPAGAAASEPRPMRCAIAHFTAEGSLSTRQSANIGGVFLDDFESEARTYGERRVEIVGDSVLLTYPFTTARSPSPSLYVLLRGPLSTDAMERLSLPSEALDSWIHFRSPDGSARAKGSRPVVGMAPLVRRGESGYVVVWGPDANRDGQGGSGGKDVVAACYSGRSDSPKVERADPLPPGRHVKLVTASPTGEVFAVTWREGEGTWSISRIEP